MTLDGANRIAFNGTMISAILFCAACIVTRSDLAETDAIHPAALAIGCVMLVFTAVWLGLGMVKACRDQP